MNAPTKKRKMACIQGLLQLLQQKGHWKKKVVINGTNKIGQDKKMVKAKEHTKYSMIQDQATRFLLTQKKRTMIPTTACKMKHLQHWIPYVHRKERYKK